MFRYEKEMKPITKAWCEKVGLKVYPCEPYTPWGPPDVMAFEISATKSGNRINLAFTRLIFIELKLSRMKEVIGQAVRNLRLGESFIGMPTTYAQKILKLAPEEVGVLAISETVEVLRPARSHISAEAWHGLERRCWRRLTKQQRAEILNKGSKS